MKVANTLGVMKHGGKSVARRLLVTRTVAGWAGVSLLWAVNACSSQIDVGNDETPTDDAGTLTLVELPDGAVIVPDDNPLPEETDILVDDDGAEPTVAADGGPVAPDPCDVAGCGPGQRCEVSDGGTTCVDLSCDELDCSATERCAEDDQGGHVCVDASCDQDVDCAAAEHCGEAGVCVTDVCEASARTCDGDQLLECTSNGATEQAAYTCGARAYFESECTSAVAADAACSCEDDWDCPAYTVCEVAECRGTGVAPTCTLPPTSFEDTQPSVESHWGGDSSEDDLAHDGSVEQNPAPWPESSHVWATPMVANLDDDNGDGLVNELDFPEILFTSYVGGASDAGGVLRAIHGGGPNRGKDFFALCGDALWSAGDAMPGDCAPDLRTQSPIAVADLDGDRVPEIVLVTLTFGFKILNARGELLIDHGVEPAYVDPAPELGFLSDHGADPSIANLDYAGLPELIFAGTIYKFNLDEEGALYIDYRLDGVGTQGFNEYTEPMSCVADLHPNPGQELLAGSTLYALPEDLAACDAPPCHGALQVLWSGAEVNQDGPEAGAPPDWDGFCAVADVWGAQADVAPGPDNPPDGTPEAILIANGSLLILDGATGQLRDYRSLGGGLRGGPPNVDDFDGDGYMEIASALQDFYVVIDLQEPTAADGNCPAWPEILPRAAQADQLDNPNLAAGLVRNPGGVGALTLDSGAVLAGSCEADADCADNSVCNVQAKQCVCLHNGWQRDSDDDSSRATSSSVFDFNGDGAAEVLYNDECNFRVYNGVTGSVLFSEVSRSRTFTENPVVADVDNDGNAEVVTVMNTEQTDRCDDDNGGPPAGPNGIRVWGDPQDTWVSARRIWNQQSYHVTNITEGGYTPTHAPESWGDFDGRTYNTFRSQPRSFGVAPDLRVAAISVFSADSRCGQLGSEITIVFEIVNQGDLRVGPGVEVALHGTWDGEEEVLQGPDGPLTVTLDTSIEPGRSITRSATFTLSDQDDRDTLPESVRVVVDSAGSGDFGAERECNEDNNDLSQDVEAGDPRPDLSLELGEATVDCSEHLASVEVTVTNDGTEAADPVTVQIFAGDPGAGGTLLTEVTLDDPLAAGDSISLDVQVPDFPVNRRITLWGWVDPSDVVEECNESDNSAPADNAIECRELIQVR